MSARWTLLAVVLALLLAAVAVAQPPNGIIRPENESSLRPLELGAQLFAGNCASCHGSGGRGVISPPQHGAGGIKGQGPPLTGAGAQAADFYLRTGYMPLGNAKNQPEPDRRLWDPREIRALTAYVARLGTGEPIPHPDPGAGSVAEGLQLFTEHCAGCHQVAAQGGVVTGARAPAIEHVPAVEIAEAVRVGPFVMPSFSKQQISDRELNSIIAYVKTDDTHDQGGWGIGRVGPIPEGMVTWLLAAVVLVALCVVVGTRLKRE